MRVRVMALALAAIAAACGNGDAGPATDASPSPTDAGNVVEIQGFQFRPGDLSVKVGDSVTWQNRDEILHTATAGEPGSQAGLFDGVMPEKGESFAFRFDEAGTVAYFCTRHNHMRGTIVVQE